jgi:hypothetical protein
MPLVTGVLILLVLLWAAKRSRARGILNIGQQRLSGVVAILIAALLLVRGLGDRAGARGFWDVSVGAGAALAAQLTGRSI